MPDPRFRLDRLRVGTVLSDGETGQGLYFQPGDDETTILDEFEALDALFGPDEAAAVLWGDYGHLAITGGRYG